MRSIRVPWSWMAGLAAVAFFPGSAAWAWVSEGEATPPAGIESHADDAATTPPAPAENSEVAPATEPAPSSDAANNSTQASPSPSSQPADASPSSQQPFNDSPAAGASSSYSPQSPEGRYGYRYGYPHDEMGGYGHPAAPGSSAEEQLKQTNPESTPAANSSPSVDNPQTPTASTEQPPAVNTDKAPATMLSRPHRPALSSLRP